VRFRSSHSCPFPSARPFSTRELPLHPNLMTTPGLFLISVFPLWSALPGFPPHISPKRNCNPSPFLLYSARKCSGHPFLYPFASAALMERIFVLYSCQAVAFERRFSIRYTATGASSPVPDTRFNPAPPSNRKALSPLVGLGRSATSLIASFPQPEMLFRGLLLPFGFSLLPSQR